jgi:hypothetical protein
MKLASFGQFFEKYSNIKFHRNPCNGSRVVPCGRTDRYGEANSRFSQFCERAKKNAAYKPTTESTVLIKKLVVSQLVKKFHVIFFFLESEGLVAHSNEPTTGSYPELEESLPQSHPACLKSIKYVTKNIAELMIL